VLQQFDARQASGESADKMAYAEIARQASGESADKMAYAEIVDGSFRFMKAQGVEAVCLNCHAAEVEPEVEAALREKYPSDKARGYELGQIRGAFSLSRDL
jgi:hypothetical protein